jgi:hypothetical protein
MDGEGIRVTNKALDIDEGETGGNVITQNYDIWL